MSFELWRLDDNGNRFLVGSYPDRAAAEARLAQLTRSPHKQTYWIAETRPDAPATREITANMTDCDFYCGQILTGRLEVPLYCQNDLVFAFRHTKPIWEQHVVLLPKKHVASLVDLGEEDNELLLELMRTARRIAREIMEKCGGARVYTNLGEYQSSKQLHWHIGGGRQLRPY